MLLRLEKQFRMEQAARVKVRAAGPAQPTCAPTRAQTLAPPLRQSLLLADSSSLLVRCPFQQRFDCRVCGW